MSSQSNTGRASGAPGHASRLAGSGSMATACAAVIMTLAFACAVERSSPGDLTMADSIYGPGTPDPSGRLYGNPPRFEEYSARAAVAARCVRERVIGILARPQRTDPRLETLS